MPSLPSTLFRAVRVFVADVSAGMVAMARNGLALLGLVVLLALGTLALRADLRLAGEEWLHSWLLQREVQSAHTPAPPPAAQRATATELDQLPLPQARVAQWLGRKYRVAPEAVAALVAESHRLAASSKLPAHLILAVLAIESNFHPYIQSEAGAQGLMQVMTRIHAKRYEAFGGPQAAFDPLINLRVGVQVLQDCIKLKGGSVDDGLRFYLGGDAVGGEDGEDGGYVAKVRAEQARLDAVAAGRAVAVLGP